MKKEANHSELIRELIETGNQELCDEELMHMLIAEKLTSNSNDGDGVTLGQRAADAVARFAGSWAFIFSFLGIMALWMVINILLAVLLNLVLSCIAAVQAPLIMMSQNRQEAKDRARAENDYRINLKSELIIDDLHLKLDKVLENEKKLTEELAAQKKLLEKLQKSSEKPQ